MFFQSVIELKMNENHCKTPEKNLKAVTSKNSNFMEFLDLE